MTSTHVAALFAELLDLDDITPEDDFFEMGGTSILALRLVAEIERRWGVTIPLIDIVYNATPEGVAATAAAARTEAA